MNCVANKLIISGWIASLLTIGFLTLTFNMYLGLTDLAYMLNGAFFIVLFIGALIINRSINQNIKKSISTAANSLSFEEKKAVAQALFEAQDILDSKVVPLLRCGGDLNP